MKRSAKILQVLQAHHEVCCERMDIKITIPLLDNIGEFECRYCKKVGEYKVNDNQTQAHWLLVQGTFAISIMKNADKMRRKQGKRVGTGAFAQAIYKKAASLQQKQARRRNYET